MKNFRRMLALLLTVAMLLTVTPAVFAEGADEVVTYTDVRESDWYYDSVMFISEAGWMLGTGNGKFEPNAGTSRAMLVTVLHRSVGEETATTKAGFSDVSANQWYAEAVDWAAENGIVIGYPDGTFKPDQPITREEMATFYYRFAQYIEMDCTGRADLGQFTDGDKVADWAEEAMQWATYNFIVRGRDTGDLDPQGGAKRCELAAMMERLYKSVVFDGFWGKTIVMHTNDVHGNIEGYAAIAFLRDIFESVGADVILVDAGDYSQGTTYVSTTKGANAVKMMNVTGYDVATLGNHEFDYGYAALKDNMTNAEFEVICANILDEEGAPIFAPTTVVTSAYGLEVGFLGLNTPEAQTKANPALIKGLEFKAGDELYACAQEHIDELAATADTVIGLTHLGVDGESEPSRSIDLLENTTGLDIIIDGHSHTVMSATSEEPIQSTGSALQYAGLVILNSHTGEIEDTDLIELKEDTDEDGTADSWIGKNETVAAAAQEIIDAIMEEYGAVFATSEVELNGVKASVRTGETNLGNLITDAMLWVATKEEGSIKVPAENVVAITNGGGIRASIGIGDITKNDINTVLPFGNTVSLVYVTGAELLEALEASTYCTPNAVGGFPHVAGLKFTLDTTKAYDANPETYPNSTYYGPASINRVTITEVNGQPFDINAVYGVVTNDFLAGGGDTYYAFASATDKFDTGIPLDEAVMQFITEELNGVVGQEYAAPEGRITIIAE